MSRLCPGGVSVPVVVGARGLFGGRRRVASKAEATHTLRRVPMSDDSKRRRGRPALHQNGGSLLVRAPSKPGNELQGGWTREQLLRMDGDFVAAVEAAIRLGLENRASASACERPGAGDSAPPAS